MAPGKDIHHDAQGAEGQAADGEVASPPGAQAHEEQVVDAGEDRRQGDPWEEKGGRRSAEQSPEAGASPVPKGGLQAWRGGPRDPPGLCKPSMGSPVELQLPLSTPLHSFTVVV